MDVDRYILLKHLLGGQMEGDLKSWSILWSTESNGSKGEKVVGGKNWNVGLGIGFRCLHFLGEYFKSWLLGVKYDFLEDVFIRV